MPGVPAVDGVCRRYPPQVGGVVQKGEMVRMLSAWPRTHQEDSCGCHEEIK
jgi:hypothetical protein